MAAGRAQQVPVVSSASSLQHTRRRGNHGGSELTSHHFVDVSTPSGLHEVIVETPAHGDALAIASMESVEQLVYTFRERGRAMLASDPSLRRNVLSNSG